MQNDQYQNTQKSSGYQAENEGKFPAFPMSSKFMKIHCKFIKVLYRRNDRFPKYLNPVHPQKTSLKMSLKCTPESDRNTNYVNHWMYP